jgi:hypothetical protein
MEYPMEIEKILLAILLLSLDIAILTYAWTIR